MRNAWELYEQHRDFAEAEAAIEAAWAEAKSIAPDQPSHVRARLAEKHVYETLKHWSEVGATDSEPMAELRHRVAKHFGAAGEWV